ncbi:CatB-related O-acetyltransferase [Vulcanococcus limneticus]|uniref:CatB-related O-acetyltransferase n=1 Tax=Vulcanococcus limneticus TaxID=2170428 RepID=UPI00398BFB70
MEHLSIYDFGDGHRLRIGSFNSIAPGQVVFLGGNHRVDWTTTYPFGHLHLDRFPQGVVHGSGHPVSKGDVVIENDVWIGYRCTVLSGVRIGSGSVVAAKSVVTRDVPPYAIVAGDPAKVVRYRFSEQIIRLLCDLRWWDLDDDQINKIVPLLQSNLRSAASKSSSSIFGPEMRSVPSPEFESSMTTMCG